MKRWHLLVIAGVAIAFLCVGSYLLGQARRTEPAISAQTGTSHVPPRAISTPPPATTAAPRVTPTPSAPATRPPGVRQTPPTTPGAPSNTAARRAPSSPPSATAGDREAMRAAFSGKMRLMRLFRNLPRLDEGTNRLSREQAAAILGIMSPLRTKKTLTPEEADAALKQFEAQLTTAQKDELQQMRRRGPGGPGGPGGPEQGAPRERRRPENGNAGPRNGGPGGPGGGPGGPGGGPGGPGGAGGMSMEEMRNMNPFYTAGADERMQRMAERINEVFTALEAKAK